MTSKLLLWPFINIFFVQNLKKKRRTFLGCTRYLFYMSKRGNNEACRRVGFRESELMFINRSKSTFWNSRENVASHEESTTMTMHPTGQKATKLAAQNITLKSKRFFVQSVKEMKTGGNCTGESHTPCAGVSVDRRNNAKIYE